MANLTSTPDSELAQLREQAETLGCWDLAEQCEQEIDRRSDNTPGSTEVTSTDYLPRHADEASFMPIPESRAAYDLLIRAADDTSDRAVLARWRREAFELLMKINPTKRGRRHAYESDTQVELIDNLLALRGEYLASRTSAETIQLDWDLRAISYLSALARWS